MRIPLPGEFAQIDRDNFRMVVQALKCKDGTMTKFIELQPYDENGWKRDGELHLSEDEFKREMIGVQIGSPRISYTGHSKQKEITLEDTDGFAYQVTVFEQL